jgi:exosortase D (VPLPA-CTERM-specific)
VFTEGWFDEPAMTIPNWQQPKVWTVSTSLVVLLAAVVLISAVPFREGLALMWESWITSAEYSHGLIIPFVSAFLIWQQKDRLQRTPLTGSWLGVAVVMLGGFLLLLGQLATVWFVVQYAFLVTLAGLVLAFTGRAAFRFFAVPLLILVFMVPLPAFVLNNLSSKLQLLSSQIGVWFMRLFDVSVYLEGNVIDLGGYKLQVAEACDGLRYLFPLMTLGFLVGYFYKGALWKRIAVFLSSIPITILMNSFRIGTIGVMVEHWGIGMAEGFLHQFQGWMVFMLSLMLMLGELTLLSRLGPEPADWRQLFGLDMPPPAQRDAAAQARSVPRSFVAAMVLLGLLVAATLLLHRPHEVIPKRQSFAEFPVDLAGRRAHREPLESIYVDALKLDDYFLGDFTRAQASPVNLYIAYYASQRSGEAVHSPRSCLPGGGWQITEFEQRALSGARAGGEPLRVNRVLIESGNDRQLVYYWFKQRDRVLTDEFAVKWYLFWDALTRQRTDGALVRLMTPVPAASDVRVADRRLTEFAAQVSAALPRYVAD